MEPKTTKLEIELPQNTYEALKRFCELYQETPDKFIKSSIESIIMAMADDHFPKYSERLREEFRELLNW